MPSQCGPILYFRHGDAAALQLTALLVTAADETPPNLITDDEASVAPESLWRWRERQVWRYDFALKRSSGAATSGYRIGSRHWPLAWPGERLRVAFTACNGDAHNDGEDLDSPERNARWRDLVAEHGRDPFHLLLQGGDQLYADDVWREVDELRYWSRLPRSGKLAYRLSEEGEAAVADFYFERYCRLWGQDDLVTPLAEIPSLMMWDDHDIFDGWGSHKAAFQACPVFQAVGRQARRHFMLFQLGIAPDDHNDFGPEYDDSHFGWVHRLGDLVVVAPDLRSNRTRNQVLGEPGWRWLTQTLDSIADCRRVLLLSTVPIVNVNLSLFEKFMVGIPGQQNYQDDLRDQWCSYAHSTEWHRLVDRLLDWSAERGTPITVVSGEIHLAAHGRMERSDATIEQLISSGVAHSPPPTWLARIYDWLARRPRRFESGVTLRMLPLPEIGRRYLAQRNWLALTCNPDGSLDACWRPDHPKGGLMLRVNP